MIKFDWLTGIAPPLVAAWTVLWAIVVFLIAIAVKKDAKRRMEDNRGVFLVGPWMWFFVTLICAGPIGAFGYWVIHYSSLRYIPGGAPGE
jgi:hypothetical protein